VQGEVDQVQGEVEEVQEEVEEGALCSEVQEEVEEGALCSEVHTFLQFLPPDAACAAGSRLARFVYRAPGEVRGRGGAGGGGGGAGGEVWCRGAVCAPRPRTRSNPTLGEESDSEGDIEVPRYLHLRVC